MSHNIKVIYSRTPPQIFSHDESGTNVLFLDSNTKTDYSGSDKFILEFSLHPGHVSDTFVEVWNSSNEKYHLNYNTYTSLSSDEIMEKQRIMNETIKQINAFEYKSWRIPDELVLEINGDDPQVDKLNALHRFFEDCSYDTMTERDKEGVTAQEVSRLRDLFVLLEQVNYLVHRTEGGSCPDKSDFLVFRNSTASLKNTIQLTDDEYNKFIPMTDVSSNCSVFLDYSTVGKDLEACWHTNDLELVRARELKQQGYINPAFNFTFNEFAIASEKEDIQAKRIQSNSKNQWCEENDVGEYYDYWLPKYNVGRIRLGFCSNKEIKNVVDYRKMLNEYPYIVDVIVE